MMSGSLPIFSSEPVEVKVWPEGAPHRSGLETVNPTGDLNFLTGTNEAILTIFEPRTEFAADKALLFCPGGGYAGVAMNHEGMEFADFFNSMGITYGVLQYRMPNGHSEVPVEDAKEAMKILRMRLADGTKLGIGGASAGGHLASVIATLGGDSISRPDFQVLLYPVISMIPEETHLGSHNNLLGENPGSEIEKKFSSHLNVANDTPPAFIVLSADDRSVKPQNSLSYFEALINVGVPASLHVYPSGDHGWGNRPTPFREHWMNELRGWLDKL